MFCKYCGAEVSNDDTFCTKCGSSLNEPNMNYQFNPYNMPLRYPPQPPIYPYSKDKRGFATTSFVLGLIGIIAWIIPLFGFPITIIGLIFGIKGSKSTRKGLANAGIVLSTITLMLTITNSVIGVYEAYHKYQQKTKTSTEREVKRNFSNSNAISDEPLKSDANTEIYRIVSSSKLTQSDLKDIGYIVQDKSAFLSSEAKVFMTERNGEYYIKVYIPNAIPSFFDEINLNAKMEFIALYGTGSDDVILTNKNIKTAVAEYGDGSTSDNKNVVINIEFDEEGTKKFADATAKYIGDTISISLNDQIVSAPVINEVLTDGKIQINNFTSYKQAERIATYSRLGKLDVSLEEVDYVD